jgi:large subunit ribosomal protein L33
MVWGMTSQTASDPVLTECFHAYNGVFHFLRAGPACIPKERFMAKSKKKAEVVFLVCKESGDYNYTLRRKPGGEKLSRKKYCPRLRKHTEHTEKKK